MLVGSGVWAELRPGTLPLLSAAASLALFVTLVLVHQRVRRRQDWARLLMRLNATGLLRLDRQWNDLPSRAPSRDLQGHAYGRDLDLFGRPSVAQLLGPINTPAGVAILEEWLLAPATPEQVMSRQEAIRELAPLNDLRDHMAAHALTAGEAKPEEFRPFLQWAEEPPLMTGHVMWRLASWVLPVATLTLIAADVADVVVPRFWLIPLLASAALSLGRPGAAVRDTFRRAFSREGMFKGYPELMETITGSRCASPLLRGLQEKLSAGGVPAPAQMRRLQRLMHLADLRYSPMIYVPVQLLFLWDFHVMSRVDRWRQVSGSHVRRWLDAAGEIEALSSLAVLSHDHPEWSFPEIQPSADAFVAEKLGHPMLPTDVRVDNDVTVGPPGSFLLVTGSNMSGKSTLLRAIGLNTVLALTGAPVCAKRLRLPPLALWTSIHVEDSLVRGVSFFMAQLQRMKAIVAAADEAAGGQRLLYLLDEILQGTNTAERRIAATRVIGHLVERRAIGAVTTHDLELATEPSLAAAAQPVHFRESVQTEEDGLVMTFDYKLRPGVATSTNALKLMEIVGLGARTGGEHA